MLSVLSESNVTSVIGKFVEYKTYEKQIIEALKNKEKIYKSLGQTNVEVSSIYNTLKSLPIETIVFYYNNCDNSLIMNNLLYFHNILRTTQIKITGEDLKTLGVEPGPIYKVILDEVTKAKLKGFLKTKEEELEFAINITAKLRGEKYASIRYK